jgi:hypothetical protein
MKNSSAFNSEFSPCPRGEPSDRGDHTALSSGCRRGRQCGNRDRFDVFEVLIVGQHRETKNPRHTRARAYEFSTPDVTLDASLEQLKKS